MTVGTATVTAVNAPEGRKRLGPHGTDVPALIAVQKAVQGLVRRKYPGWSTPDREDLESIVVEKYVTTFGRGALPEGPDGQPAVPRAWLSTVMTNAAIDLFRKQEARPADPVDFGVAAADVFEGRLLDAVNRKRLSMVVAERVDLARALVSLGDAYPTALSLIQWHVIEDKPLVEVAALAGKSEAATKKAIQRAIERLRDLIASSKQPRPARAALRRVARRT